MIFLFDSFRGRGYNDDIMTVMVHLPHQGPTRWPAPPYATRSVSRGLERRAREGAAARGAIRRVSGGPIRRMLGTTVHLVPSGENFLCDPRVCAGVRETEAASP